jgi:hypothetical protein
MMCKLPIVVALVLLMSPSSAFAETKSAKAPAQPAKPEADIVKIQAFDAGNQKRALAHKTHSADKRLFAGYYRDGWDEVISIHDAKSGKQIRRIVGHGDEVRELQFTPDGKILASRCGNRGRHGWALWNVETGALILRLPVPPSGE